MYNMYEWNICRKLYKITPDNAIDTRSVSYLAILFLNEYTDCSYRIFVLMLVVAFGYVNYCFEWPRKNTFRFSSAHDKFGNRTVSCKIFGIKITRKNFLQNICHCRKSLSTKSYMPLVPICNIVAKIHEHNVYHKLSKI